MQQQQQQRSQVTAEPITTRRVKQQLLFPVAFWDPGAVPEHEISCLVRGSNYLVTGSKTGELCYWRAIGDDPKTEERASSASPRKRSSSGFIFAAQGFKPTAFLMREGASRCTALVRCLVGGEELFLAATSEGFLTLWEHRGGRCLLSRPVLPFAATRLHIFTTQRSSYVVCSGNSSTDVYIVKIITLITARVLRHRTPLVGTCIAPPTYQRTPFLFTLTLAGNLHLWDLEKETMGASDGKGEEEPSPRPSTELPSDGSSKATDSTLQTPEKKSYEEASEGEKMLRPISRSYERLPKKSELGTRISPEEKEKKKKEKGGPRKKPPHHDNPAYSLPLPLEHMPSPPCALAISQDGSRLIILFQRHWLICSARTLRAEFPLQHNTPFDLTYHSVSSNRRLAHTQIRDQKVAIKASPAKSTAPSKHTVDFVLDFKHPNLPLNTQTSVRELEIPPRYAFNEALLAQNLDQYGTTGFVDEVDENHSWIGCSFVSGASLIALWTTKGEVALYRLNPQDAPLSTGPSIDTELKIPDSPPSAQSAETLSTPKFRPASTADDAVIPQQSKQLLNQLSLTHSRSSNILTSLEKEKKESDDKKKSKLKKKKKYPRFVGILDTTREDDEDDSVEYQIYSEGDSIFCGGSNGEVLKWNFLHQEALLPDEEYTGKPVLIPPMNVSAISDGFDPVNDDTPICTASVMLKEPQSPLLFLAQGFENGMIRVLSILNQRPKLVLKQHTDAITCLTAISAQDSVLRHSILISVGADLTIRLWMLETGQVHGTFSVPSPILQLHWHPPARSLQGELQQPMKFSPGDPGDLFFTLSADFAVRVYSILSLSCIQCLRGHDSPVQYIYRDYWCMQSDHIITHTQRGTVYVWTLSSGHLERVMEPGVGSRFLKARELFPVTSQRGLINFLASKKDVKRGETKRRGIRKVPFGKKSKSPPSAVRPVPPPISTTSLLSETPRNKRKDAVRVMPFQPSHYLHMTMYVININRFLKELHGSSSSVLLPATSPPASAPASSSSSSIPQPHSPLPAFPDDPPPKSFHSFLPIDEIARPKQIDGAPVDDWTESSDYMLANLFDWHTDPAVDQYLSALGLKDPVPDRSLERAFGIMSDKGQALTVLLPDVSKGLGRWQFDPHFSAYQALALTSVCMSLLGDLQKQFPCSRLVAHYNVLLPGVLSGYIEPDLAVLASFSLNVNEEIHDVSRLLLQGVVERMDAEERRKAIKQWSGFYYAQATTTPPPLTLPASVSSITSITTMTSFTNSSTSSTSTPTSSATSSQAPPPSLSASGPPIELNVDVPDEEIMAALVLSLIGVYDLSSKEAKKQQRDEQRAIRSHAHLHGAHISPVSEGSPSSLYSEKGDEIDGKAPTLLRSQTTIPTTKGEKGHHSSYSQDFGKFSFSETSTSKSEEKKRASISTPTASPSPSLESKVKRKGRNKMEKRSEVEDHASHITQTLLKVLFKTRSSEADAVKIALASDLLGKGFVLWRPHIHDLLAVIRRLHQLSVTAKEPNTAAAAHRALLQAGNEAPSYFVTCMGKEALNPKNPSKVRSGALIAIVALVRKFSTALAKVLPSAVQIITRCLDPSNPALRKSLLLAATAALHALVQKYPMVSFHQKTQRFAVGTGTSKNSVIIIYDLRTATKFRILEGHKGNVSAVSFSPKGSVVVSYCADEDPPTVRTWNTGTDAAGLTGFFSSLLGIQGRCTRVYKLDRIKNGKGIPYSQHLQTIKLTWTSARTVSLKREDGSECNFGV